MKAKFSTYFTRIHKTTKKDFKKNYQKSISQTWRNKMCPKFHFFYLFGGLPSSTQCCMHMNIYRLTFERIKVAEEWICYLDNLFFFLYMKIYGRSIYRE